MTLELERVPCNLCGGERFEVVHAGVPDRRHRRAARVVLRAPYAARYGSADGLSEPPRTGA